MDRLLNQRQRALLLSAFAALALLAVTVAGLLLFDAAMVTDFSRKNLAPCLAYPFGTDWMGRDMLARTPPALPLTAGGGRVGGGGGGGEARAAGTPAATLGRRVDAVLSWCIDLVMGIPHILLVMLISLAFGKGFVGVVAGVSLSHWTSLARLLRGEVLQLRGAPYVLTAEKLGRTKLQVARDHLLPHLLPQFLTGLILLFPHAILHEASVTFLGFGLSSEQPAIGVILSESMSYLTTGKWWLAFFPGLALVATVALFALLGDRLRRILDPATIHQ